MSDKINASIMLLRSKAVETFGMIKEIEARPAERGDAQKIADLALEFVQQEGALLTLQQYLRQLADAAQGATAPTENPRAPLKKPMPAQKKPRPTPLEPATKADPNKPITEKDLETRSPTFKRSTQRKRKKDES